MRGRKLKLLIALSVLASGMLVSVRIGSDAAFTDIPVANRSALDAPMLTMRRTPGNLSLHGTSASVDHETRLMQISAEQFPNAATDARFEAGVLLPDHWETTSVQLLSALGAFDAAQVQLRSGKIEIRGVTSDPATLASRIDLLRTIVGPGATIREDVIVVEPVTAMATLCRRNLAYAVARPVAFRQSSAAIRSSSFAVLDRVVDAVHDCGDARIAVTGHSDSSGPEPWNRQLSLDRAQAVADYLVDRGISTERILVAGAGSSEPIADNDTPYGRSLNRRIEFELQ